ncbi:hypothetical protein [Brevifollis gellanilyticus]|uniref:Uncharacterized protein n=1 Tax=Brevifollis gellanilyticus TaxID=748831 RepID=A0A512MF44_9BACT|nr:hypothetical protein [Brevifollis gellanilyticus]GEP44971.1 hypothetical protein BGE01nite_42620 [Brevifollis gellanilyticus]
MAFLKRVEVWVLLLLGAGAAVWVLIDQPKVEGDPLPVEALDNVDPAPLVTIHRCTLERDFGNARLDIELRYRNTYPRDLVLQPPDVKLLTADGKEVPPFILPVEKPPQIPAHTEQSVRLRYWLEAAHLNGALTLDIRGSKAEVKSAAPLDLQKLESHQPKVWQGAIK